MDFYFFILIFLLAILYSSVGHGGASGYLALMAVFSFSPEIMRPSALIMNIFVSSIAFYSFYKNGHFRFRLLWPFIITSIPFAFLGGMITVNPKMYKIILGVFLIFAIIRLVYRPKPKSDKTNSVNILYACLIGILLGFFSGLIGIGGGIILSPIIILLGWASVKETSAVSAAFILLNSVSGLSGQVANGVVFAPEITYMLLSCVLGGIIGSYLGSFKFSNKILQYALSIVLTFASLKLMFL